LLAGLFLAEFGRLIPHFPLFGDSSESYLRRYLPRVRPWWPRWCCPPT
jgi:hypothetical protein